MTHVFALLSIHAQPQAKGGAIATLLSGQPNVPEVNQHLSSEPGGCVGAGARGAVVAALAAATTAVCCWWGLSRLSEAAVPKIMMDAEATWCAFKS